MSKGKSAREFAIDLKRFGQVTTAQATVIFKKIALELDGSVVLDTAVDTGRARGNWYCSINKPSQEVNTAAFDPSGSKALGRIQATVGGARLGQTVWLTNNLPYILPLENGWSQKSPDGMVDINLNRIAAFYGGSVSR